MNLRYARQHLIEVMDDVCARHAPVMVTREGADPIVMISLQEYRSIEESLHLLRSPRNAVRLLQSIEEAEVGKPVQ